MFYAQKIYSDTGFISEDIKIKTLDIGCGGRKVPGSVGMDISPESKADIIHDINKKFPIKDDTFDLVVASHIMEHVKDVLGVLREMHRVTKNGGRIVIQVPYFRSIDAYRDLDHKNFFTYDSFNYEKSKRYDYFECEFCTLKTWLGWPQKSKNPVKQFVKYLINKFPHFYERYTSVFFPEKLLTVELEVVKTERSLASED